MTEMNEPTSIQNQRASRAVTGSIIFSAIRCTVQYLLLPFVIPWLGITGTISAAASLILEILAIGVITYNIKVLWSTSWRWRYLPVALLMLGILGVFTYLDLQTLWWTTDGG